MPQLKRYVYQGITPLSTMKTANNLRARSTSSCLSKTSFRVHDHEREYRVRASALRTFSVLGSVASCQNSCREK